MEKYLPVIGGIAVGIVVIQVRRRVEGKLKPISITTFSKNNAWFVLTSYCITNS